MNQPPPRRPRKTLRDREQQFAPVNVVMALIGQSSRRCASYAEMMEKQGRGLVQLQMECQQMAGVIRSDPQGLNRLAISLHAARAALEKNKAHLEEQIQVELFLQGEFERWLRGEPPSDFAPPPPGMVLRSPPFQLSSQEENFDDGNERLHRGHNEIDETQPQRGQFGTPYRDYRDKPPQRPYMTSSPSPQLPRMRQAAPLQREPQQPPHTPLHTPLHAALPPPAAFAAYQKQGARETGNTSSAFSPNPSSGAIPTPEAAIAASRMVQAQRPTRMPVVRLPVQHYAPASETAQTNGGTTSSAIPLAEDEKTGGDQGTSSTPS